MTRGCPRQERLLKRPFKGRTHHVTGLDDSFQCRGEHYAGLSCVAKSITATTYSGYWFCA